MVRIIIVTESMIVLQDEAGVEVPCDDQLLPLGNYYLSCSG